MSLTAFILIVLSAGLHASWNLMAKKSKMSLAFYAMIILTSSLLWLHMQFWTPVQVFLLPLQFWGYLCCSLSCDFLYCYGLSLAYRSMDMSISYPMMRALPLLFTALLTSCLGWGKELSWLSLLGMGIVFLGCMSMPLQRFSDFSLKNYWDIKMIFIIMTALGTTGYTVFDSQAQKVMLSVSAGISKPVISMTFYSIRGFVLCCLLTSVVLLQKEQRQIWLSFWREKNWMPFGAGFFASLAYVLILISMNYVDNVSFVQVFRQLGLLIGLFAGVLILKEKFTWTKLIGVFLILTGLTLSVIKM